MGIRTFTFNGESSDTYGILINVNSSFNAPERAGEMLSIPGRNGAYWHDLGRFENIEVTYHCVVGEATKPDFVDAMSDVRSWLCSPIGYCRLEDDYNPNEYRMAVYKSGLETDEPFVTGAEFDIVFDCKPQRFLKSGETAVSVTSGDTITNPTRFDAKPLIEVVGYGDININNENIYIENVPVGDLVLQLSPKEDSDRPNSFAQSTFASNMFASGDAAALTGKTVTVSFATKEGFQFNSASVSNAVNCTVTTTQTNTSMTVSVTIPQYDFVIGTETAQMTSTFDFSWLIGAYNSGTTTISIKETYHGDNSISYSVTSSISPSSLDSSNIKLTQKTIAGEVRGNSTKTISDTIYIDLDIGEVWSEIGGEMTVLNNVAQLPAELPTLSSGANTITYDNTFTSVDIVPRWWQV